MKYETKYAAMPVCPGGKLEGYIAMQCYIVGEYIQYLPDGNKKICYDVVFKRDYWTGHFSEVFPVYNNMIKKYNNTIVVEQIFETFEEAKDYSHNLNDEILTKQLSSITPRSQGYVTHNQMLEKRFKDLYILEEQQEEKIRSLNKN